MLSVVFRYGCKARGVIIESSLRRQWFDKIHVFIISSELWLSYTIQCILRY